MVAVLFGLSPSLGLAEDREKAEHDELVKRARVINDQGKKHGEKDFTIRVIANETGFPVTDVENMTRKYPKSSLADVMLACVFSDLTKGAPETYLKKHAEVNNWAKMAREEKIPLDKLNDRLDRLEKRVAFDEKRKEVKHR
jgi:hypothetical protein